MGSGNEYKMEKREFQMDNKHTEKYLTSVAVKNGNDQR